MKESNKVGEVKSWQGKMENVKKKKNERAQDAFTIQLNYEKRHCT